MPMPPGFICPIETSPQTQTPNIYSRNTLGCFMGTSKLIHSKMKCLIFSSEPDPPTAFAHVNVTSIFLDTSAKNFEVILIFFLLFYPTSNPFTNTMGSTTKYFYIQLFPTPSLATTLIHLLVILSLELLQHSPTWFLRFHLSPWVMKWSISTAAKWSFKKRGQTRSVLCSSYQWFFPSHLEQNQKPFPGLWSFISLMSFEIYFLLTHHLPAPLASYLQSHWPPTCSFNTY